MYDYDYEYEDIQELPQELSYEFASNEVFNFHLEICNGIDFVGVEYISTSSTKISNPCGALCSLLIVPVILTVWASFNFAKSVTFDFS